jgi:predicted acylesterase/phospholipase RssA
MHATPSRPKLGLALGSGAARGLAHIGVLKVLEEADIPIDIITGTSMGAFIGAMYAAGVPVAQMEQVALEIDWLSMARLLTPVMPTSGLSDGKKLVTFMAELLPVRDFKDLHLPLAVTATDINTGEAIIIKQGDLLEALHASLAFPGIFSPVRFGQRFWSMVACATHSRLMLPATSGQRESLGFALFLRLSNKPLRRFFLPGMVGQKPSVVGVIFSTHVK